MNKKSIIAIEKILNCINELEIMCTGRDDNYFYDSYEMPILCNLVNEVEINLNKISYDYITADTEGRIVLVLRDEPL